MLDKLYSLITAKGWSTFTNITQNLAFLDNDTGDAIEARLHKIEREIVRINGQIYTEPTDRKSRP